MRHIDEYRDGDLARSMAAVIAHEAAAGREYRFMKFCGGHTHAISRYGIEDLLPDNVQMVHGPGCPVCVLPVGRIDHAIRLALIPQVTLCTYADLMRVPASGGNTLLKAKAAGADVRMVYSTLDAVRIAETEPHREVVFFAIGFETTTPPTALAIRAARRKGLSNFSVFCNHVLTRPAIRAILDTRPGDTVVLSGCIGDHGIAIMSLRSNLGFETELRSDSAALHGLVAVMVRAAGASLRLMRDPTRGGLAATLNEVAQQSGVGIVIEEAAIPVREEVAAACELLGLDPLTVANEGKLVAVVAPESAERLLQVMQAHPLGRNAAVIGRVVSDDQRFVQMSTAFGGGRIVDWLAGEQLPRIC